MEDYHQYNNYGAPPKAQKLLGMETNVFSRLGGGRAGGSAAYLPEQHMQRYGHGERSYDYTASRNAPYGLQMPLHHCFNIFPFDKRCQQLESVLLGHGVADLHESYPELLANIFGFGGHGSWQLHLITSRRDPYAFDEIRRFLSPTGCLFRLIEQLIVEHTVSYAVSVSSLPITLQASLEGDAQFDWHVGKLSHDGVQGAELHLNAFEYYFLYFSMFVLQISPQTDLQQWSGIDGVIYVQLLQDYLDHFLSLTPASVHHSMSSSPAHDHVTPAHGLARSSFSSFLFNKTTSTTTTPDAHITSAQPHWLGHAAELAADRWSKSESFVQILIDVWLCYSPVRQSENSKLNRMSQELFLPTVDHARLVRIVIKHIHAFVNIPLPRGMANGSAFSPDPVTDLKRRILPVMLERKLFDFLKHSFVHWPLDPSFRMILETWLSFIQPWRYPESIASSSQDLKRYVTVDIKQWAHFITDHLHFYSTFFQLFVSRALCFDFETAKDTQLLYRVTKVFAQPDLCDIIEEAECQVLDVPLMSHSHVSPMSSGIFLAGRGGFVRGTLDAASSKYEGIYADKCHSELTRLVHKLAQFLADYKAKRLAVKQQLSQGSRGASVMRRIKSFLLMNEDDQLASELALMEDYVDKIIADLCSVFKLKRPMVAMEQPDVVNSFQHTDAPDGALPRPFTHSNNTRRRRSDDTVPDHLDTNLGPVLTRQGRFELVNGLRRFDVHWFGDPDLQPIRSYESAALVRHLHTTAVAINTKFADTLALVYNRGGVVSTCLRWVASSNNAATSPRNHRLRHHDDDQHACADDAADDFRVQVSLRCFASLYTIAYLVIFVGVLSLFDFGYVTILLVVLVVAVLLLLSNVRRQPPRP